ncbi:MAG: GIY-YIG nuclease family protein [Terriglobia bacterium]
MPFWVYVLGSVKDGKTYTGSTGDLGRRLREHHEGEVAATCRRRPLRLLYAEEFPTRAEAVRRERYFKTPEGGLEKHRLVRRSAG